MSKYDHDNELVPLGEHIDAQCIVVCAERGFLLQLVQLARPVVLRVFVERLPAVDAQHYTADPPKPSLAQDAVLVAEEERLLERDLGPHFRYWFPRTAAKLCGKWFCIQRMDPNYQ